MISEWRHHDEAAHRLKLSFAEEIEKRVARLENLVRPDNVAKPSATPNDGIEAASELSKRMETLAAEVADVGNRLERIECLLMCSNLSHVEAIDKLLRQLKDNVIKGVAEAECEEVANKLGSFIKPSQADLPKPHDGILKVWPSHDALNKEHVANAMNLEPEPENDFVPLCNKEDLATSSACAKHSVEPMLDGMGQVCEDMHVQSKQIALVSEAAFSSEKYTEQTSTTRPRRFWRDEQGNEVSDTSATFGSSAQQPQGLTFDMFGKPQAKEKAPPRKQSRSRGWNLAAEAASSGKRIVPKN